MFLKSNWKEKVLKNKRMHYFSPFMPPYSYTDYAAGGSLHEVVLQLLLDILQRRPPDFSFIHVRPGKITYSILILHFADSFLIYDRSY